MRKGFFFPCGPNNLYICTSNTPMNNDTHLDSGFRVWDLVGIRIEFLFVDTKTKKGFGLSFYSDLVGIWI